MSTAQTQERADLVARLHATDGGAAGVAQYADASIETLRFVVDSAEQGHRTTLSATREK